MKTLALLIVAALTGCCGGYYPVNTGCQTRCSTGYMIVNNTKAILTIVQDGQVIARDIEPGDVMPLRPVWMRTTCVAVTGRLADGTYVGADSYTFSSAVRETWTVTRLIRPNDTPPWN
jgi:hypothetical protein